MPKMRGFLGSKPKIDKADWEIAQIRTAARLGDLFGTDGPVPGKDVAPRGDAEVDPPTITDSSIAVGPGKWQGGPRPPIIVVGVSEIVSVLGQTRPAPAPDVAVTDATAPIDAGTDSREALAGGGPGAEPAAVSDIISPAKPIGLLGPLEADGVPDDEGAAGDDADPITDVEAAPVTAEGEVSPAKPIGVMARLDEVLAEDPWRLPEAVVPEPGPPSAEFGFALPTATYVFMPEAAPDDDAAGELPPPEPRVAVAPAARSAAVASGPGSPAKRAARATSRSGSKARSGPTPERAADRSERSRTAAAPSPARRAPRTRSRSAARTRAVVAPVHVPVAYCPYCAKVLDPVPTASRRCDRCRQRIVVKRIGGSAVYLTEAAVLVFEAERRRVVDSVRWARDRDRWLRFAATAGAPAERQAQLSAARLSEDVVAAARKLYMTTVDRAVRAARRERDWDEAARLRRDQAGVLHRVAGAPLPPPADVLAIFQEGVAAELRGVAEISRDAELVAARCCDACRGDDGRVVRIAQELRALRLPHAGCPKGLCRCHWDLATRDRMTMRRYLRRRPQADGRVAPRAPEGDPAPT